MITPALIYLAFAAMLMAGLDGIINKIEPADSVDEDLYELTGEEAAAIVQVPGSLDETLNNLERDREFLLKGGVFAKDLIDTWIWKYLEFHFTVNISRN